jgi:hypothetical protein
VCRGSRVQSILVLFTWAAAIQKLKLGECGNLVNYTLC